MRKRCQTKGAISCNQGGERKVLASLVFAAKKAGYGQERLPNGVLREKA